MSGNLIDSGELSGGEKTFPALIEWVRWRDGGKKTINNLAN